MTPAKTRNQPFNQTVQEALFQQLAKIDRPGTFSSSGSLTPILPGLEIRGIEPVALPLTSKQAEEIRQRCVQAPYGKGEQTLVDTTVRRVWQLSPEQFQLKNPEWHDFLSRIIRAVERDLGLEEQRLVPQIHDLLLYDKGSFFLPHQDGEKLERMVATLVVILPSAFSGGELIIRHEGQEHIIDFGGQPNSCFQMHYAAFYADCEHEVLPLKDGLRLCLVYNLTLENSAAPINAPRNQERIDAIGEILRDWSTGRNSRSPIKIVVKLDHQYSQSGLTWDTLKGVDRTKALVLRKAARAAGCKIHLAHLTLWEQGTGEECGGRSYRGRGRWYGDDDSNESSEETAYVMEEVHDSSLSVSHWMNDEEQRIQLGEMFVLDEEVVPAGALDTVKPDEQFEGYMGNYGMTLDRWYRHSAIVLWPDQHHFEVLCECGKESAIAEFCRMVRKCQCEDSLKESELKSQCVEFASRIIDLWQPTRSVITIVDNDRDDSGYEDDDIEDEDEDDLDIEDEADDEDDDEQESDDDEWDEEGDDDTPSGPRYGGITPDYPEDSAKPSDFVSAIETLADLKVIQSFLDKVVPLDPFVELTPSFLRLCCENRISMFRKQFENIFRESTTRNLERNARIFEQLCLMESETDQEQRASVPAFKEFTSALKRSDKDKQQRYSDAVDRTKLLVTLVRGLIAANDLSGLEHLVSYALSNIKMYPIAPVLVATLLELKEWLPNHAKQNCALSLWISACIQHLESATTHKPQKPADFVRSADISCRCDDCKELVAFLKHPKESVHRFSVRESRRQHLHRMIDRHKCDVEHVTERKGRPQTLVCTKNVASFDRMLKKYQADMSDLSALKALEAQLLSGWKKRN